MAPRGDAPRRALDGAGGSGLCSPMTIRLIDAALLDEVSGEAKASPRGRKNRNFHPADPFPAHRLLIAIEPSSYVPPHRHLSPLKGETLVVVRGALGFVALDDAGEVVSAARLSAAGDAVGCDVPHGVFHTVVALEPGTVFFEAKAGPYTPLGEGERAPWAPAEGEPEAPAYLATLRALFP